MTNEEKQLLIKDLSARLPYGVNVYCEWNYLDGKRGNDNGILVDIDLLKGTILFKRSSGNCTRIPFNRIDGVVKPYLRPMESMTEEEEKEYNEINCYEGLFPRYEDALDYILEHHLDYRKLIEKGLALEAPEGMYNFK